MRRLLAVAIAIFMVSATFAVVPAIVATLTPISAGSKITVKAFDAMRSADQVNVIIRTSGDYGAAKAAVESVGGSVRLDYRYVDYLAATVPSTGMFKLASQPSILRIMLDEVVQPAIPVSDRPVSGADPSRDVLSNAFGLDADVLGLVDETEAAPLNYFNSIAADVTPAVIAASGGGDETLMAVIDTGIYSGHFLLDDGRVIDGEDFSPDVGTAEEGFDRAGNHPHGTGVAAVAAGKDALCLTATSLLVTSIEFNTGLTLASCAGGLGKVVSFSGIAPETFLVGYKVFPSSGAGVASSIIDAAIIRVIDEKIAAAGGDDTAHDFDVVNMSLGGPALFDGREAQELLIDFATSLDITFVIAAGNEGPASMTVASPGVGNTPITAAAAQHPVNSRVFWDTRIGFVGAGLDVVISDDIQVIFFSSRGPASDGAAKPDIIATGNVLVTAWPAFGPTFGLAFVSGTSFSTPTVAGAVSLLNSAAEKSGMAASPFDYEEALEAGADPSLLPGYDADEFGAGYLQVDAAWAALLADPSLGSVEPPLGPAPFDIVDITSDTFDVEVDDDEVTRELSESLTLAPGHKREIIFPSSLETELIELEIEDVEIGRDVFGLDSLVLSVHNAKRGGSFFDYYIKDTFIFDEVEVTITNDIVEIEGDDGSFINSNPLIPDFIEPGFQKIVIENDWVSSDDISFEFELKIKDEALDDPDAVATGTVANLETDFFLFSSEEGDLEFLLVWENDWSKLPTHDLNLILLHFDDDGFLDFVSFQGATLDSPERAVIEDGPEGGIWLIIVDGFTVFAGETEPYAVLIFED